MERSSSTELRNRWPHSLRRRPWRGGNTGSNPEGTDRGSGTPGSTGDAGTIALFSPDRCDGAGQGTLGTRQDVPRETLRGPPERGSTPSRLGPRRRILPKVGAARLVRPLLLDGFRRSQARAAQHGSRNVTAFRPEWHSLSPGSAARQTSKPALGEPRLRPRDRVSTAVGLAPRHRIVVRLVRGAHAAPPIRNAKSDVFQGSGCLIH